MMDDISFRWFYTFVGGRNFLFLFMLSLLNLGAFCWDSIVGVEKGGFFFFPHPISLFLCFGSWKVDSAASSLTELLPFSPVSYFSAASFFSFSPIVLILVILYPRT